MIYLFLKILIWSLFVCIDHLTLLSFDNSNYICHIYMIIDHIWSKVMKNWFIGIQAWSSSSSEFCSFVTVGSPSSLISCNSFKKWKFIINQFHILWLFFQQKLWLDESDPSYFTCRWVRSYISPPSNSSSNLSTIKMKINLQVSLVSLRPPLSGSSCSSFCPATFPSLPPEHISQLSLANPESWNSFQAC